MSARICCMCQSNLALPVDRQLDLFGRTFVDEEGESPCIECITEMEQAEFDEEQDD